MSNEELVKRIQTAEGVDRQQLLAELYEKNIALITKTASRYAFYGEMDDLMQQGYIGLQIAAERFDPAAGAKFATYAPHWIRAEISRYIEDNGAAIRISGGLYWQLVKFRRLMSDFEKARGRQPTDDEIGYLLDLTPEQLDRLREADRARRVWSADAKITGTEDLTILDSVPDPRDRFEEIEEGTDLAKVWAVIDELPDDEAQAVKMYYKDGLQLKECAEALKVQPNEARNRIDRAFRKLRSGKLRNRLAAFIMDEAESFGYSRSGLAAFRRTGNSSVEAVILEAEKYERYLAKIENQSRG